MKKLCFLFVFSLFAMGSVFAQGGRQPQTSGDFTRDPGGELRSLLPEGVTAFVNNTRKLAFTKVAIIGEIWKSRAKLLRNRLFKKIASATE